MPKPRQPRGERAPPARVIIGIDPGVAIVGYAVISEQKGKLSLLACDIIRTPAHLALSERLRRIHEQLQAILAIHHPTEAAVELSSESINFAFPTYINFRDWPGKALEASLRQFAVEWP